MNEPTREEILRWLENQKDNLLRPVRLSGRPDIPFYIQDELDVIRAIQNLLIERKN